MVSNPPTLINKDWTDEKCFEILNATENEKNCVQVAAGIIGYNAKNPNKIVIDQAFEFSKIKEVVTGSKKHRHDQSIYSVLAARYEIPLQKTEVYAEWRGTKSNEQVLYVHCGKVTRKDGLIQKADKPSFDENERIELTKSLKKMKREALLAKTERILIPFLLPVINFLKKR